MTADTAKICQASFTTASVTNQNVQVWQNIYSRFVPTSSLHGFLMENMLQAKYLVNEPATG
jgi:hypothetical protein